MYKTAQVSGFTLVELLVTVSLIAIVTGAVIPNFNSYIRNQNLIQAKEIFKSDLRSVQNKALTGAYSNNTVLVGGVPTQVKYWGVYLRANSGTYTSFITPSATLATCNAAVAGTLTAENIPSTSTLQSSIQFQQNGNSCCLFFSYQNGDITNTCTSSTTLNVGYSTTEMSAVTYNSMGLIY